MGTISQIILLGNVYAQDVVDEKSLGAFEEILKIISGIIRSEGISLWVKAILIVFLFIMGTIGGVWWSKYRESLRQREIEENRRREQERDIANNQRDNEQAESDANRLRDQIRNK